MLTLHLIRHAKSSWENIDLLDEQRPLKTRGIRDCALMAVPIKNAVGDFNNIYCSQAVRAQQTIKNICNALPKTKTNWQIERQLYSFDYHSIIHWLRTNKVKMNAITLIGHNPAFTELINYLSNAQIENLPTCGYAQLIAKRLTNWQDITKQSFELTQLLTPKQFK